MDSFAVGAADAQPIVGEIRDQLLEPFIEAARTALGEMAATEVLVQTVFQTSTHRAWGNPAVVVGLLSAIEKTLVLSFPNQTAAALARRILAGVTQEMDENLIRDCMGEIANVVAGQAKAMLAGGPYRFTFALPQVIADAKEWPPQQGLDCLVVAFKSDQGEFALQLYLKR